MKTPYFVIKILDYINYLIRKKLFGILPDFLKILIEKIKLSFGYNKFLKSGITDDDTYHSLINLYCYSNGEYIEKFANRISVVPRISNFPIRGILGEDHLYYGEVIDNINKEGYHIFKQKLNSESIKELIYFAENTYSTFPPNYDSPIVFDKSSLKAEIYRFNYQDLINNKTIQSIIMDQSLIEVARQYLNAEPIFDFPAMWWSTNFLKEASSEAAQKFHFDLDRLKWLKLFIYLTDVDLNNGPHCYISGSHIVGNKPKNILKKGYARIEDNELMDYYSTDKIKTICGESGTMFVGDTKCWHKGTSLKEGVRLVLELQYTSSLFGVNIPHFEVSKNSDLDFVHFCNNNKFYTQNFKIVD